MSAAGSSSSRARKWTAGRTRRTRRRKWRWRQSRTGSCCDRAVALATAKKAASSSTRRGGPRSSKCTRPRFGSGKPEKIDLNVQIGHSRNSIQILSPPLPTYPNTGKNQGPPGRSKNFISHLLLIVYFNPSNTIHPSLSLPSFLSFHPHPQGIPQFQNIPEIFLDFFLPFPLGLRGSGGGKGSQGFVGKRGGDLGWEKGEKRGYGGKPMRTWMKGRRYDLDWLTCC